MLTFVPSLFASLAICAISSFFIFFAKNFRILMLGVFCFLSGVVLCLLKKDIFSGLSQGHIASSAIVSIFGFEFLTYALVHTKKILPVFYALPLLAFITLAISTDLITVLLGLMLFGMAFILLAKQRNKKNVHDNFLKINVGLSAFSYGIAVIFSRIGTIKLSDLHMQVSTKYNDEWLMFGFGLLCLGVLIELYAIFASLKKEHK